MFCKHIQHNLYDLFKSEERPSEEVDVNYYETEICCLILKNHRQIVFIRKIVNVGKWQYEYGMK